MSLKKTLAGAMPFAHLLSNGPRAARAEEQDDERKQRDGESDDDYAKRMEELDEKERAEEEERKQEEAKKANKADDVDGDDADMEDGDDETDDAKKAARASERARCARIIAHGIKIGSVRQAGVFAFDTRMSSKAAIAALDASKADAPAPAPKRAALADRMSTTQVPNPGVGGAATAPNLAQQIIAAGKKRRGEA
ncbi:hypothetical protein [Paraburkholderia sp. 2C]